MRIIQCFGCNATGATRHRWIYCICSNLFPAFNLQHFLLPQTPGLRPQSRQQAPNEIWMKEGKCDCTFLLVHCRWTGSFISECLSMARMCDDEIFHFLSEREKCCTFLLVHCRLTRGDGDTAIDPWEQWGLEGGIILNTDMMNWQIRINR